MEANVQLPDIHNGFIINGLDGRLRWKTHIESCLIKSENGEDRIAYLSTECRTENVSPRGSIFSTGKQAEFTVAHTWKGPFIIRSGSGIYHPFRRKTSEKSHYQVGRKGNIHAPLVDVTAVTFDELLRELQSDGANKRNSIYMKITWKEENATYDLICQCRYINFPIPGQEFQKYLQPISGNVLVEHNHRFHLAYVATYVMESGTRRAELAIKVRTSLFKTKKGFLGPKLYWAINLLTAPFAWALLTDEFSHIKIIDAECVFLNYPVAGPSNRQ